jgi:AcrR family transcriptional regulator
VEERPGDVIVALHRIHVFSNILILRNIRSQRDGWPWEARDRKGARFNGGAPAPPPGRHSSRRATSGPSLRGIARRAGVHPALIYHYFDGKEDLFTQALKLGRDPREIVVQLSRSGGEPDGADLVKAFLGLWESPRPGDQGPPSFGATAQAVSSSPEAAAGLREYLEDRVWSLTVVTPPGEREHRWALVASQLVGLAWARYLLRLEPLVSAPPDDVARWIGPTLDRYLR